MNNRPVVYMTTDISPQGLMAVYKAMGWTPTGKVAVKLSTGEPPASNYLDPDLIADLVRTVDGTIVECNTAYGGSRAETAMHYQVAEDHGFTAIADFQIQDENGSMALPVEGGTRLTENYVGAAFADYDSYLVLSHFKGHAMAGFGGAIKNISIGLASSEGKAWIHSGGTSRANIWGGEQDAFLESMAEAGKSVSDALGRGERIAYVNVMNRLIENKNNIIADSKMLMKQLTDCTDLEKEMTQLQVEMNVLSEMLRNAIDENARAAIDQEEYNRRYDELEVRYKALATKYDEFGSEKRRRQFMRDNFRQFISTIEHADMVTEFSPEAWTALVESVTVNAKDDIRFNFRNGMSL